MAAALSSTAWYFGELQSFVDEDGDDEGIDGGHGGGFGRGEETRIDAAEHQENQQQPPNTFAENT